ncbi:MAG: TRAP transporter substrate-binding protein [Rhodospirillaceae bacterium]|nr:TRAP transporter substrate-binding protein [Rhodospirillaceae bacterium]
MRTAVIGIVIGSVVGVMLGTTVIAPRLTPEASKAAIKQAKDGAEAEKVDVEKEHQEIIMPPAGPTRAVIRWRMASAYASSMPLLGSMAKRIGKNIWEVSDGGIEIKMFEPGQMVPTEDMFEAVASGAIEAAFSSPALWYGKAPAVALFASVPFGPSPDEYMAWYYFGGGSTLMLDIYRKQGIHSIACGMTAPAAAGWFRRAFTTPDDLNGIKMRTRGLTADVMGKLGVTAIDLKEADIFMAFEDGRIDAAEFSLPVIDAQLGFHDMAGHYYFPGWHRPATFFELMINKDKWDALPRSKKSQIETVCGDNVRFGLAESEAAQYEALKELTSKGVKIKRWPAQIMTAMQDAWRTVAAEKATADADFRIVWRSLSDFRKNYEVWKELSRP